MDFVNNATRKALYKVIDYLIEDPETIKSHLKAFSILREVPSLSRSPTKTTGINSLLK